LSNIIKKKLKMNKQSKIQITEITDSLQKLRKLSEKYLYHIRCAEKCFNEIAELNPNKEVTTTISDKGLLQNLRNID